MLASKMGDGWLDGYISSSFVNITLKLSVRSCSRDPLRDLTEEIPEDELVPEDSEAADHLASVLENSFNWIFNWNHKSVSENVNNFNRKETDDCTNVLNISYETSIFPGALLCASVVAFFTLSLFIIFLKKGKQQYYKYHTKMVEDKSNKDTSPVEVNTVSVSVPKQLETADSINGEAKVQNVDAVNSEEIHLSHLTPLLVSSYGSDRKVSSIQVVPRLDTSELLRHTVDHFLAELDQILGMTAAMLPALSKPSATASESSLTPRMQNKCSRRRPKWQVPSSRPLVAEGASVGTRAEADMWQRVVDMGLKMGWRRTDPGELDVSGVQDSRLSAILKFYQRACPVPPDEWSAATLIVNYVLTLVLSELTFAERGGEEPVKILDFHSYGSAANGTCIARANRFNVMLILQLTCSLDLLVTDSGVREDLPAGKLLLSVNEQESVSVTRDTIRKLLVKTHAGESFGYFLSPREVTRAAQTMLANAVERLRSKSVSAMEQLPFKVYLAPYEDLVLCIETNILKGLGLPQILIYMTPAIRVTPLECDPLPALYAIPQRPLTQGKSSQPRSSTLRSRLLRDRNQSIPADVLWQLSSADVMSSFMSYADRKLRAFISDGCHVMCQQILRALFSHCGKETILHSGEICPRVLDSVVCFLFLESHPKFWEFSCLPDRLSDCILFLKTALQSERMPDFVLHNPHLQKHMPALKLLPLLTSKRQENLFASLESDDAETVLAFIDARLQETGLNQCMKVECSEEMWEYEFFLFG